MVYILETEISNIKKIRKSLIGIYGLGKNNSKLICKQLGLAKNVCISDLSRFHINKLIQHIDNSKTPVTSNLKKNQKFIEKKISRDKIYKRLTSVTRFTRARPTYSH